MPIRCRGAKSYVAAAILSICTWTQHAPLTELNENWVLAHELSHLIHPYVSSADSWLAEGLPVIFKTCCVRVPE